MKLNRYTGHTKTTPSDKILEENLVVSSEINHPSSYAFNVLRTKVLSKMQANNWRVLAVTSPLKDAGKSFTAVNLAVSIALEENHSALLIDFDFKNPSIQRYFGITQKKGLSDYFYNNIPLSEILVRPDIKSQVFLPSDLVLLPAGKDISRSAELLSSSKLISLIGELKDRYSNRIIIVDLPPLLDTADAMTVLNSADSCLLVVAVGESTVDNINQSMRLIDEKKFIGSIFNKSTRDTKYTPY